MKSPEAAENPCQSRTWVIGLTIFITGSIGNMVAMVRAGVLARPSASDLSRGKRRYPPPTRRERPE
eukprot:668031-Prymnesium_polylepis.1